MFAASDTSWAPWFVARSEDKKRVRLNVISHLLSHIPYESVPTEHVRLPKRKIGRYKVMDYPFRYIAEKYRDLVGVAPRELRMPLKMPKTRAKIQRFSPSRFR